MNNKKGAIEFSMTTIMIVIIGVAVLALGLAWIRGTFRQIGEISEEALDKAGTVLFEGTHIGKINAPATIILKPGEIKKFEVWVRNDNPSRSTSFNLGGVTYNSGDRCLGGGIATADALTIKVGEEDKFLGYIKAEDTCGEGATAIFTITITGYGQEGVTAVVRK